MKTKTPIMLIAGTLGSGKTTLLRRIVDTSNLRLAVFMNEFGEVSVDARVLRGKNVEVIPLPGGSGYSSAPGEFEAAFNSVLERVKPHAIVVETAGITELHALVLEFNQRLMQARLDSVVYVADAYSTVQHPHLPGHALSQISAADIVLINKIDLVTMDEIKRVETLLREYNPHAVFFKTMGCDVDPNLLFGLDVERMQKEVSHHGEPLFQSFLFLWDAPLNKEQFLERVARFPKEVYRAKGFVVFESGSYLFNYVLGRVDLEEFPVKKTQIIFMGRQLEHIKEELIGQLRRCGISILRS